MDFRRIPSVDNDADEGKVEINADQHLRYCLNRLTCNVEFGGCDLVLHFALVKPFVFTADVCDTQLTLLAVLHTKVFWIVDVNRLQHTTQFNITFLRRKSSQLQKKKTIHSIVGIRLCQADE